MPDCNTFAYVQTCPYAPGDLEICMWRHVANEINRRAIFFANRCKSFGATGP